MLMTEISDADKDTLTNLILTTALGKLLVRKGVITKDDLKAEIQAITVGPATKLLASEIDKLLRAVENW